MRHGLVEGSTTQQVLSIAEARGDRKVIWLVPESPVCASFGPQCSQAILDKPAGAEQSLRTSVGMELISNILVKATTHATRRGKFTWHSKCTVLLPLDLSTHAEPC